MATLASYVRSLMGVVKKNTVLDQISNDKNIIIDVVIPMYTGYYEYFTTNSITNKKTISLLENFIRFNKQRSSKKEDVFKNILNCFTIVNNGISNLENLAEKDLENNNLKDGMSVNKAFIIRISDYISAMTAYAVKFISYIAVLEERELSNDQTKGKELFPKITEEELLTNLPMFSNLINYFTEYGDEVYKDIKETPEMMVDIDETVDDYNENNYLKGTKALKNLPTNNFIYNPIYHIRLIIADIQVENYESKKQYKKTLELRLLHLKALQQKQNDPNLERQIEYYDKKISKLEYSLRKTEEGVY